jgi:hypothetical protein
MTHDDLHTPSMQLVSGPHATPQSPQFALSESVDAQYAASPATQSFSLSHVVEHVPFTHASNGGHAVPHAPQFERSLESSTHDCPHGDVPAPQLVAHAPSEHTKPSAHATSHAPQFAGSL